MATGQSTYADISSLLNIYRDEAFDVLREHNVLVPTVTSLSGEGLMTRQATEYNDVNVRQIGETDDVTPTQFNRTQKALLTPYTYADQVFVPDSRLASDDKNMRADAMMAMGNAFAADVDTNLATNFASLTAGTVGTAGSTLTWNNILAARSILQNAKVPGPYYCALHPYQFNDLLKEAWTNGNSSAFVGAPQFQDRMVSMAYQQSLMAIGVTFVISANIAVDGSDDATGAMYARNALAYDERRSFRVEAERDASRGGGGWELNFSLIYAHGVWAADRGVQIISDASTPS